MSRKVSFALAAIVAASLTASTAFAGKFNKVLSIGNAAPAWSKLIGIDGKPHSLSDYEDAKLVVLVFTCNHCPVAQSYEERIIALQKDYEAKGVKVIAISCSHEEIDSPANMKEHAKAQGFNFPYLHDQSQASGRAYGAAVTPEIVVLDGKRNVAYLGAIDDAWDDATLVKKRYLRDALDLLLAGKPAEIAETRAKGCGIQYE